MSSASPIRVAIIMAGGSGERFWPLSRADHPEQLLALTHPHRSMLEEPFGWSNRCRMVYRAIPPKSGI